MLSVGDRVLDDTLEEDLEDTSGLFVDQTGDSPKEGEKDQQRELWEPTAIELT